MQLCTDGGVVCSLFAYGCICVGFGIKFELKLGTSYWVTDWELAVLSRLLFKSNHFAFKLPNQVTHCYHLSWFWLKLPWKDRATEKMSCLLITFSTKAWSFVSDVNLRQLSMGSYRTYMLMEVFQALISATESSWMMHKVISSFFPREPEKIAKENLILTDHRQTKHKTNWTDQD
jgi:hypothetical protein